MPEQFWRELNQQEETEYVFKPVDLSTLSKKLEAINVGLESFAENLTAQDTPVVHVEWRPPAGGNEKLVQYSGKNEKT